MPTWEETRKIALSIDENKQEPKIIKHVDKQFDSDQERIKKFDTESPLIVENNKHLPIKDIMKLCLENSMIHVFSRFDLMFEETSLKEQYFSLDDDTRFQVYKDVVKEINNKNKVDITIIRNQITQLLVENKRRDATEIVVKYILSKEKIYTTREDDKNQCWIYKDGIYIPNGRTYIKEISRQLYSKNYTTHIINEIILKCETDTYIDQEEFFEVRDIYKIALKNGVFDIKTKKLLPFSHDYFFFNKLPFNYDKKAKCEEVITFFKEILPNENDINIMQELFGFLLLKEYRFEKAFMLTGGGRNGKGKTVELIKRFLGVDNIVNIPIQSLKDESYNVCELHNKLANIGADISNTVLKETGMFKSLTGRDLMSAQRKYFTRVKFTNYAKMIFCANELPITYDKTLAFFNRWIILDFPYTFLPQHEIDEKEDKQFLKLQDTRKIDKISSEKQLEGLFNWALEGFDRIINNNGFSYCKGTEEVKMLWIRKSSSISAFMEDFLEEDYDSKIHKKELRYIYSYYCREHKIKPVSDVIIKNELSKCMGVHDYRYRDEINKTNYNCWEGIKFKKDNPFSQPFQDSHGFHTLGDFQKTSKVEKGRESKDGWENSSKNEIKEETIR